MWSPPLFISLFACLLSFVAAQCPTYNNTIYTDTYGAQYTVYCSENGNSGAYTSTQATSLADCMNQCTASGTGCTSVTLQSATCYMKNSFTGNTYNPTLYSASRYFPITYPAPQANYVNSSLGCGTPLGLPGQSPGGATITQNFTAPDGTLRSYNIHIPSTYNISKAAPLIMTFHGQGSSPAGHEAESGWSTSAWNPYSIVVYPAGIAVSEFEDGG